MKPFRSFKEMARLIDRAGWWTINLPYYTIVIPVRILDARLAFGQERVQVMPIGGSGLAWTNLDTITFEAPTPTPLEVAPEEEQESAHAPAEE